MKISYFFIFIPIILLTGCKSTDVPRCCEFDDRFAKLEVPENTTDEIFTYGSETTLNLNLACNMAKSSACGSLEADVSNSVGAIQKFFEENLPLEQETEIDESSRRIIQHVRRNLKFELFETKAKPEVEGGYTCEVIYSHTISDLFILYMEAFETQTNLSEFIDKSEFEELIRSIYSVN